MVGNGKPKLMSIGNYPYGQIVASFNATPTFDCSTGDSFKMTLTGNVTSMTVSNAVVGMLYTFVFAQDSSGLHSVAWPANFKGVISIPISALANTSAVQTVYYDGTNFYATAIGQLNL